jgi:dTMP kinase
MVKSYGKLIVFEGVEGSGKSTQSSILPHKLSSINYDHLLVREPGGTKVGEKIREIILHEDELTGISELFLLSAARHILISQTVQPALEIGRLIISDRFFYSSLAYQGGGRKVDDSLIKFISKIASANLIPDLIILLDIAPENSLSRKQKNNLDRFERENQFFHNSVRNKYLEIAEQNTEKWFVIDASQKESDISDQIWDLITNKTELLL